VPTQHQEPKVITKDQIETAKEMWEEAGRSATHVHESYQLLSQFQQTLLDTYRAADFPFPIAIECKKLIDGNVAVYKAALEQMDNMNRIYGALLEQFKNNVTDAPAK
jgi:hypothetical protein